MLESKRPGRVKLSIPQDCTLEQLLALQQQYLMFAPYSRQLRQLKRFANQHPDRAYGTAFNLKLDLFEKQQREFRPNCLLSGSFYRVEKTLGRILSSRALKPLLALTLAVCVATGYRYPHLLKLGTSESQASDDLLDMVAAYEMRVEKADEAARRRPDGDPISWADPSYAASDDEFMQKLLNCLNEPSVREALAKQLQRTAPNRNDQQSGAASLADGDRDVAEQEAASIRSE